MNPINDSRYDAIMASHAAAERAAELTTAVESARAALYLLEAEAHSARMNAAAAKLHVISFYAPAPSRRAEHNAEHNYCAD